MFLNRSALTPQQHCASVFRFPARSFYTVFIGYVSTLDYPEELHDGTRCGCRETRRHNSTASALKYPVKTHESVSFTGLGLVYNTAAWSVSVTLSAQGTTEAKHRVFGVCGFPN